MGRVSGGKENLSGKGAGGSRQTEMMAEVEVSMVGHCRAERLGGGAESSIKRQV